jgi:hypothetical protein
MVNLVQALAILDVENPVYSEFFKKTKHLKSIAKILSKSDKPKEVFDALIQYIGDGKKLEKCLDFFNKLPEELKKRPDFLDLIKDMSRHKYTFKEKYLSPIFDKEADLQAKIIKMLVEENDANLLKYAKYFPEFPEYHAWQKALKEKFKTRFDESLPKCEKPDEVFDALIKYIGNERELNKCLGFLKELPEELKTGSDFLDFIKYMSENSFRSKGEDSSPVWVGASISHGEYYQERCDKKEYTEQDGYRFFENTFGPYKNYFVRIPKNRMQIILKQPKQ